MSTDITRFVSEYPLVSDQMERAEIILILQEIQKIIERNVAGDLVEFGCYVGTTALFVMRYITAYAPERRLHIYDSFEGLPAKTAQDESPAGEQFQLGELHARKQVLIQNFLKANLPIPHIHKNWFSELSEQDIPAKIAFAFLDGDFYDSIMSSLLCIEGRLSNSATIIVDDYLSESLPGAKKAVDKWLNRHENYELRTIAGMAIIRDGKNARR